MQCDNIGFFVQGIQIHVSCIFFYCIVLVHIICQDTASESGQNLDNGISNLAGTDNTHGEGTQFPAHFTLQCEVVVVCVVQCLLRFPDAHQDCHYGVFRNAVRSIASVGNPKSQLSCIRNVDVVVSNAAECLNLYSVLNHCVQNALGEITLSQCGHAIAALAHLYGGRIQNRSGGNQFDSQFLAASFNNRFFVRTDFISSNFHVFFSFTFDPLPGPVLITNLFPVPNSIAAGVKTFSRSTRFRYSH